MAFENTKNKGKPNGYAGLDKTGKVPAGQVGDSGALVTATPSVVTQMVSPIPPGDIKVHVFPADVPALAFALEGDEFPRLLIDADAGNGIYFGEGAVDPYQEGSAIYVDTTPAGPELVVGPFVRVAWIKASQGLILTAPDNSLHRVKVANDGTLSTEAVA